MKDLLLFEMETPDLLTVYVLDDERVYFSVTGNRIEMWHISSLTFPFSCPSHARIDTDEHSMARAAGRSSRCLPLRSQTHFLRES